MLKSEELIKKNNKIIQEIKLEDYIPSIIGEEADCKNIKKGADEYHNINKNTKIQEDNWKQELNNLD